MTSIINKVIKEKIESLKIPETVKFVLAVSGGPDSQCLLKAFPHIVGKDFCFAIGIDHGLRTSANKELDLAESLANDIKVKFERIRVTVEDGSSVMAQARDARYAALMEKAVEVGAEYIVTGHNFDDQAETVLIHLFRGFIPRKMEVVRPLGPGVALFRPMLTISRSDILGYLKRWNVPFAEDPSNADPKYLRSWIRHELLPMMETKSPQIRKFLTRL